MKHQQKRQKTDYTHPKIPIPILPWSKLIQGAISRLGLVESWKMPTFLCFPVASQVIKSYWKRVFFMNPSGPDPWKCGLAMPCQLFFDSECVSQTKLCVCVCASLSEESVKWPRLHSVCALTIQARDHSDIPWHVFLGKSMEKFSDAAPKRLSFPIVSLHRWPGLRTSWRSPQQRAKAYNLHRPKEHDPTSRTPSPPSPRPRAGLL